ncbi:dTMP kinase [Acuticoccus sp. I52.16.1]|uniref:dTMP kinase n=1 Tax=Acuticoccus sp. I52.16.1 TaxID=2928472 RepID=UPI001FD110F6|nr:dTMP kinase [Acuticoccus sp. I52.16.1]UOM34574.1 dTMP kinase [Acuticoccus sp. I52.16.1]
MKGAFVTFEGGDGAGKSTQARRLAVTLRAKGRTVTLTREPGGSPWAERLRAALLSEHGAELSPAEQALLFAAARADHVDTLIAPALAAGHVVICDRFADSTEAYQGAAGVSAARLATLGALVVGDTVPDLTIVLDCPADIGHVRTARRGGADPFDRAETQIRERRRQAFLAIAAREPGRCAVVDATQPADIVADRIWRIASERLALLQAA